jgi:hypothetical protein
LAGLSFVRGDQAGLAIISQKIASIERKVGQPQPIRTTPQAAASSAG